MLFFTRNNEIKENCIKYIRRLQGTWQISITQTKRTSSQNAYFHALLDIVAPHTPWPSQTLKEALKAEWLGFREIEWKGKKYQTPIPSSSLDKAQYSVLLEKLIALAEELDVSIPDKKYFGYERS